jgi:hypothetical protein
LWHIALNLIKIERDLRLASNWPARAPKAPSMARNGKGNIVAQSIFFTSGPKRRRATSQSGKLTDLQSGLDQSRPSHTGSAFTLNQIESNQTQERG